MFDTLKDRVLGELAKGTHTEAFADGARYALTEAHKLQPSAGQPDVTWRELKDKLRPLKAFEGQDEIALGAAADAVLELLSEKSAVA